MAKEKALKTKTENLPAAIVAGLSPEAYNPDAWGKQALTAKDITIPKIFAMQGLSKAVAAGDAKMGEFRDSNGILLGSVTAPIEFLPFYRTVEWVIFRKAGPKPEDVYKFNRIEAITPQNDNMPLEYDDEDGNKEKWYRATNFFMLLPKELADGGALPYLMSFRSTSARAGSQIATTMYIKNLKPRNLPEGRKHEQTPAGTVMELVGEKVTNDKGTFIVMKARDKRASTAAEVAEAFQWAQTIQKGAVKIDHSDLEADTVVPHAAAAEPDPTVADQF